MVSLFIGFFETNEGVIRLRRIVIIMKLKAFVILGFSLLMCPGCLMAVRSAARAAKSNPPNPLVQVLDTNHDGVIDEAELASASNSLKSLDRNNDGKLTADELKNPRR
jgi:hypothetical protein